MMPNKYNVSSTKTTIHIPINTSLLRSPQCSTKSALLKNLNASASSKKPSTTLVVVIHPPDFGNEFNQFGKSANNANGSARAVPNPVIPAVNWPAPPSADNDPASRDPKIGPVHENETIARVSAIKKIPTTPPILDAESILLPHELGKVNS